MREWRQRRRLSQLDLAGEADISTRHLSFVETGRSLPSREMLLHLAERLEVPLARTQHAAHRRRLCADVPRAPARRPGAGGRARSAVELVLNGHEPYPALAVDRHWTCSSRTTARSRRCSPASSAALLKPPVNVLRLSLHPEGLAPRIVNLAQWRAHLLARLRQQIAASGDAALAALLRRAARRIPCAGERTTRRDDRSAAWSCRCSCARRRRRAVVHQHDHGVRHAGRHHAVGAGARDLLPGRRRPPRRRCVAWVTDARPRRSDKAIDGHPAGDTAMTTTAPPHLPVVRSLLRARIRSVDNGRVISASAATRPTCSAPATSARRAWR